MDADGLTLTGALLVLDNRRSGFRFVTILMDGVEVHKLSPRLFLWFSLCKNSFKKVVLLDINLWAPSYCKKIKRRSNQDGRKSVKENKVTFTTRRI